MQPVRKQPVGGRFGRLARRDDFEDEPGGVRRRLVPGLDRPRLRRRAGRRRVLHVALRRHVFGVGLRSRVQLWRQREWAETLRDTRLDDELNDSLLRLRELLSDGGEWDAHQRDGDGDPQACKTKNWSAP